MTITTLPFRISIFPCFTYVGILVSITIDWLI
eukprot:CAMPEP_0171026072 /NCGR_PEP_ID=MMETSP0736-20130129/34046_1 /TAXON_ID=186038 /ORGANISM="Fragilariopsis kerguelensis, Strain L26-C5" /LENGTH=31 /DNA_ID= /DNA_START= /DNA_END= /DNA_ORIENTATION=